MEVIFWLSVAAVGYAYVGYPLLLSLLSKIRPKPVHSADWTPSVSVIIAAYNEERDLAAKLRDLKRATAFDSGQIEFGEADRQEGRREEGGRDADAGAQGHRHARP